MIEPLRVARHSRNVRYAVRDIILVAEEAERRGRQLLYLNIGDPVQFGFQTPAHIVEAYCRALRDQRNSYAPSLGVPQALDAIRHDAVSRCGIRGIRDVFVGSGCSECIEMCLAALLDEGDSVLLPYPGYPLYSAVVAKLGCQELPYYLDEDNGWQPDLLDLESRVTPRTRAIVVINPGNPTGTIYNKASLERVIDFASRHNLVILADETYDRLLLNDVPFVSMGSLSDEVPMITFNGMSKAYMAPGLRLGWAIVSGPERAVAPWVEAMQKFLRARICANHPVQYTVAPALTGDHSFLKTTCDSLRRRRDIVSKGLNALPGVSCVPPEAAFYVFPSIDLGGRYKTDDEWVRELILATGVVVVPGGGFGERPGSAHFRVVFLPEESVLEEALSRLASFLSAR